MNEKKKTRLFCAEDLKPHLGKRVRITFNVKRTFKSDQKAFAEGTLVRVSNDSLALLACVTYFEGGNYAYLYRWGINHPAVLKIEIPNWKPVFPAAKTKHSLRKSVSEE